jgi:hypothetical protein
MFSELLPVLTMRGVVQDFERLHDEDLKAEEVEHQQKHGDNTADN